MSKTVSVIGRSSMTASLIHAISNMGHEVMIGDKPQAPLPKKQYKPLGPINYKKPVNGYQAKQRKRKARRKDGDV